jgi:L-threonylcarbamoyladenylate synthase
LPAAERAAIQAAVEVLRRGGLVAFPTETVYGLGADASNPSAVRRIFTAKGRPPTHPLIVHLGEVALVKEWAADVPDHAWALAEAHWPGPLTLVLRRSELVPDEVTGGLDTVGLRVPAQPLARELLGAFGGGVAAPSANRFGRVSPTTADHVRADLGDRVDLVLDGGPCPVGVESTIVDCTGPRPVVLRLGGVTLEDLAATLGGSVAVLGPGEETVPAPGTLPMHYAPRARVEMLEPGAVAGRAAALVAEGRRVGLLAPDPQALGPLPRGLELLPAAGGPTDYARCLYSRLREADTRRLDVLLAVPPPAEGLGAAVVDRLQRAAAPGS